MRCSATTRRSARDEPDAGAETMSDHGRGDRSAGSRRRRRTSLAEFKFMYQG